MQAQENLKGLPCPEKAAVPCLLHTQELFHDR